jgi:hypothetical protein
VHASSPARDSLLASRPEVIEAPRTSGSTHPDPASLPASLGQNLLPLYHLYEESVLYDCTFKVGFQESGFRVISAS